MKEFARKIITLATIFVACSFIQSEINPLQWHWVTKTTFTIIVLGLLVSYLAPSRK